VAYQHQPSARDAGLVKVAVLTVALSVAGVAGTAGIGMAIASAAPTPKKAADYSKGGKSNQADGKKAGKPGGTNTGGTKPGGTGTGGTNTGGTNTGGNTGGGGTVAPPEDHPESSSGDEQTSSGGS
jgi:hypothetical protein